LRGLAYGRDVYQQSSAELPSQRATNCANAEVRFNTCLRCTGHLICRMGVQTESGAKRLEIKKYPNRRYYDATHSRHLTLDEIRSLIQQGYDLRVVDAKTSADITAQVLTHIILELDTPKLDSLPVPLLVRIIRMNDQLVKDFIDKYFNQALESFLEYQRRVEEQIRRSHGLPSALPLMSAWTKAVLQPFSSALKGEGAAMA